MTRPSLYLETTIVSYLTARPSGDLLAAAWQKSTVDWWYNQRLNFDLYISEIVLEEAGRGDREMAQKRLELMEELPRLSINDDVTALANIFLCEGTLPEKAIDDALHIAIASVHRMDYLLTWNCRHIDNAQIKPLLRRICTKNNLSCPEICTPQELMGINQNE